MQFHRASNYGMHNEDKYVKHNEREYTYSERDSKEMMEEYGKKKKD